ncbi:collagen-like triple helix repeat-containing protein [Veillonella atypica]|uniref:collagen-like triple helix repeat-containing protein n=1 Tax=Veillonella atypica TaxID=39777 RepID=UPI003AF95CFD
MEDTNNFEYVEIKAKVPKVIDIVIPGAKGLPGEQGKQGPKGEPFRYEDFTPEQLEALKGPKGDKGEDGRDGTSATADNAHQLLLQGNVWCESASVDDVLTALIGNMGKPFPRTEFKPLTIPSVFQGQQVVAVTGEPHYSVKVVGNDTPFTLDSTGACTITIPPLGEDDVRLTYHNFIGEKVGETVIAGIHEDTRTPDETYEENGVKYALFGRNLEINAVNFTGSFENNFKFLGKWRVSAVDNILIKVSRPTVLKIGAWYGRSYSIKDVYGNFINNIPILVNNPKNLVFENNDNSSTPVKLGSVAYGTSDVRFTSSQIEWSDSKHKYVNTGDTIDHL